MADDDLPIPPRRRPPRRAGDSGRVAARLRGRDPEGWPILEPAEEVTDPFDRWLGRTPMEAEPPAEVPMAGELVEAERAPEPEPADPFEPEEPRSLEETGLTRTFVEHLVLKHLLDFPGHGSADVAEAVCLNPAIVRDLLADLKRRLLVQHVPGPSSAEFYFDLTAEGRRMAWELREKHPYVGPAPVPLEDYRDAMWLQSIQRETPDLEDLQRAFADLVLEPGLLERLGPAMTSGRGLFLFGHPGNGKTSIALRMGRAYRGAVHVPHALLVEGQVVQVYDPQVHEALPRRRGGPRPDRRWVRCRRPTVIAAGELTMDSLELALLGPNGPCEAPLQLKANGGLLVIDDFGRQRVPPAVLLNRWILPLENRVDYLRLPGGRKVQVPFDPLLVFSTNLDPKDLVDEAFLRRIPYKIPVIDPTRAMFRELYEREVEAMGFSEEPGVYEHLVRTCYDEPGRPMRACHVRDLLVQVRNQCLFRRAALVLTPEAVDAAAQAYFTLL